MEYFALKNQKKELSSVKELLEQRNQTIDDREAELNLLRNEEAENERKGREMETAQEAMRVAQAKLEEEKSKLEEEKAAMRRRIAELEVLLEEEKRANEIVLDPDIFFNDTISQDPAVVSTVSGRNNDLVVQEVFDVVCNPSGTQFFVPVDISQSFHSANGFQF